MPSRRFHGTIAQALEGGFFLHSWKKQFAIIYAGQAFSLVGSAAVQFAIIWQLTVQTESAITLTVAAIVGFIPNMVLGPFAGVWIDRCNRRTVMIAADGLVALSSVALGVAYLQTAMPPVWFVYVILFLRGLGSTFHTPAMQAAIPMLVPQDMLTKAGGWGSLISSLSNMLGPVLGAALMGMFSIAPIMLVDIFGAAFAIICLLFVRIPDIPQSAEKPRVLSDMRLGFRAVRENRPLMAVFFPMVLCNVLFMPLGALYPLLVRTHFGGGAFENSIVEFVFAGGLLVSSLAIGVWGRHETPFSHGFAVYLPFGSYLRGKRPAACGRFLGLCGYLLCDGRYGHVYQCTADGLYSGNHRSGGNGQGVFAFDVRHDAGDACWIAGCGTCQRMDRRGQMVCIFRYGPAGNRRDLPGMHQPV